MHKTADVLTVVVAVAALAIAGVTVIGPRGGNARVPADIRDRRVDNWDEVRSGARHVAGKTDAAVTIVEFGDYECPACGRFARTLRAALRRYPDDLEVRYRHLPLNYHRLAYSGARAAECAADQGAFARYHWLVVDQSHLLGSWDSLAVLLKVPSPAAFRACISNSAPDDIVDADIALAKAVGASGTPAVLINGILLGRVPDSTRLVALVRNYIR